MTAPHSFAEMDMTEALESFRRMSLPGLLDTFEGATTEWEELTAQSEYDWPRLCNVGKAACCLAQLIHLKISNIQRRREMPFRRCLALFGQFIDKAKPVVDSLTGDLQSEQEALRHHVENIGKRIKSLDLMGEHSSVVDKSFGLDTEEEDELMVKLAARPATCGNI